MQGIARPGKKDKNTIYSKASTSLQPPGAPRRGSAPECILTSKNILAERPVKGMHRRQGPSHMHAPGLQSNIALPPFALSLLFAPLP